MIGVIRGPPGSRIIWGQTLSLMSHPYVEAARVLGAEHLRIMLRHLLPNVIALVLLGATLRIGAVVPAESPLSFLVLQ